MVKLSERVSEYAFVGCFIVVYDIVGYEKQTQEEASTEKFWTRQLHRRRFPG